MGQNNLKVGDFVSLFQHPSVRNSKLEKLVLCVYKLEGLNIRAEHVVKSEYGGSMSSSGNYSGREWVFNKQYASSETPPVYAYKLKEGLIKHPDKDNLIKILEAEDKEGQQFAIEILKNQK